MKKKKIAVLGSTGSIGVQALKIIKEFSENFELSLISANSSDKLLLEQALFFQILLHIPLIQVIILENYVVFLLDVLMN